MSVDEFMAWNPGDGGRWQSVDAVPHAMSPTDVSHGTLLAQLAFHRTLHIRQRGLACSGVLALARL